MTSKHLLLINPNTQAALTTALLAQLAPAAAAAGLPLLGATAGFGHAYIASEASYAIAAHAVIDAWQRHVAQHGAPRAVLVACFGDPGVWALRELAQVPVIGLAEAALREAATLGPHAVLTGGTAWAPMLQRLARAWGLRGLDEPLPVHTVDAHGGELAQAAARGRAQLQAGLALLRARRPELAAVVLGGAALGGWAAQLEAGGLTLIDSVAAGGRWLKAQGSEGGSAPLAK